MQRRQFLGVVAATPLAAALAAQNAQTSQTDPAATWKFGLAKAKITPQKPMWLAGYADRKKPSEGVLHDIWVKALALEDAQGQTSVLITSDLLGFPQALYDGLCKKIESRTGLDRGHVMFTVSHTHTGPVLDKALFDIYPLDDAQKKLVEEYTQELEGKVVDTVVKAMADRRPATLWAGEGRATFAVNRRNNPEASVPEILSKGGKLKGPSDHEVPVLAVRSPQGELLAVVCGYSCHCTTLSDFKWSGDYAGFAQLALEKNHPGAEAMFFQGCGADQNPLPRRSVALCEKYGQMLAKAVDEVLAGDMRPIQPKLKTAYEQLALEYGEQPAKEELETTAKAADYTGRWAKRLLAELNAGKKFPAAYEKYPVQVWRLGDEVLWIVLGGEVVVDYSLKFKAKYGKHTWVGGYANDCMCYIPSRRVWQEGGYEAGAFTVYGLPAKTWSPQIEDKIGDCVERLAKQVQ